MPGRREGQEDVWSANHWKLGKVAAGRASEAVSLLKSHSWSPQAKL